MSSQRERSRNAMPAAESAPASRASAAAVMTVRTGDDGVTISVHGLLDQLSGRALREAVETAMVADGHVAVDLDHTEGFTSDAIRDLAACAQRGALLRFNPGVDASTAT